MKYLILSKNNNADSTMIDANNMSEAKNILQKSLNRNNINEKFKIIDLVNSEKKHYVVKKNKTLNKL
jgi:hypothetical protein